MIRLVRKLTKRMLYPSYGVVFFSLLYWGLVGFQILVDVPVAVHVLMAGVLIAGLVTLIYTAYLDRYLISGMEDNLQNLSELNARLREQRHEYLNEMQVVYGLMELEEYEEAMRFLKPLYGEATKTGRALKTSLPAVNALLQNKLTKAEQMGVRLILEVSSSLRGIPMEAWSVCHILGNLIDNALTAVEKLEGDKEVHVILSEDRKSFSLSVYNNGPEIPKEEQGLLFRDGFSTKAEEGHGFGLGIVERCVKEAGGQVEFTTAPNKTCFTAIIDKREKESLSS
ncbi:MAG: GHKL domain-containing protein [Lachnospiraceae bacterium]|nr:GHKL domain-containing protein [Lachnospiraceae bacterium]